MDARRGMQGGGVGAGLSQEHPPESRRPSDVVTIMNSRNLSNITYTCNSSN